jgi:hypothetical protein
MRPMQAFHADAFVLPLPPGHTFPMGKYRLLRESGRNSMPDIRVMPRRCRRPTANWRWRTTRLDHRGGRGHDQRRAAARDRLSLVAGAW